VSPPGIDAAAPAMAMSADGQYVIAWTAGKVAAGIPTDHSTVQAVTGRSGATWSAIQTLSSGEIGAWAPAVAITHRGEAVAVWEEDLVRDVVPKNRVRRRDSSSGTLVRRRTEGVRG
jgi:hypothetical protein